jgi:hypothetical protein
MGSPFAAPFITEGRPASFGGKTAFPEVLRIAQF